MSKETTQLKRIAAGVEQLGVAPRARDTSRPEGRQRPGLLYQVNVMIRCSDKRSEAATARRRSTPIMAYVGPNGGGKSLAMVKDTLQSLDRGRMVLSTLPLIDSATGKLHEQYVSFTDWEQLVDAKDCDVLMDEMVGVAGAREFQKLPVAIQNHLVKLRKTNTMLRWTAPNWARADKIVREVTQAVTLCNGYYSARGRALDPTTGEPLLWQPKRLFRFRTFDTIDFDEWTTAKTDKQPSSVTEWFVGPGSRAFASYDTLGAVERVKEASPDGRCPICGKRVREEYCKTNGVHESTEKGAQDLEHQDVHFALAGVE